MYDDTPRSWAALNSLTGTQSPFVPSQTSVTVVTLFSPSGGSTAPSACASAQLGQTPLANNQSAVRLCKNCRRGGVFSLFPSSQAEDGFRFDFLFWFLRPRTILWFAHWTPPQSAPPPPPSTRALSLHTPVFHCSVCAQVRRYPKNVNYMWFGLRWTWDSAFLYQTVSCHYKPLFPTSPSSDYMV